MALFSTEEITDLDIIGVALPHVENKLRDKNKI